MFKSSREKFLFSAVLLAIVIFGGSYFFQNYGETAFALDEDVQMLKSQIAQLQQVQKMRLQVAHRYKEMEEELKLENSTPEQQFVIRNQIREVLNSVGLGGKYVDVVIRDPEMEQDFKIMSISINQISCTPRELGRLLFELEKSSQVMEIRSCNITNMVGETGKISMSGFRTNEIQELPENGVLRVDLDIARLVDYAPGEAPKRQGARTS